MTQVSIIVPLYNEEDNVRPLSEDLTQALSKLNYPFELIFVDDGSSDGTRAQLSEVAEELGDHVSVVELQRNFGQTAAMQSGIDQARGDVLVTLDGDLQNDPADIPAMVQRLIDEELDLLVGWRKDRKDNYYGCSLKVYRAEVIHAVRIYGEMHRFIPAWMATHTATSRIKEQVVNHRARQFGYSKYGLSRTYRVLLDLLSVYFFMSFMSRPAHFFGRIGIVLGAIGGLILGYLLFIKIFVGDDIGGRPLLLAGVLLVIMSIQFFCTGILGEFMTRTYYEATDKKPYAIRERYSSQAISWR
jgi:glycosyltransferase involved in cell wall biosynthesis